MLKKKAVIRKIQIMGTFCYGHLHKLEKLTV